MSGTRRHSSMNLFVVGMLAVGILLWARLKLVTNVPRRAYAEPPRTLPQPPEIKQAAVEPVPASER